MPSWNGSWALPVVFDMFQDIEQAGGRNAVREETGCLQGATHYLPDAPTPGIANPVRPRLQEHNLNSGILQSFGHKAITAADVE
jgi:hypothetical protein